MRLFAFLIAALLSMATGAAERSIIDLDAARSAIGRGALVWDTRDEETFAKGHIGGAVNIGDVNSVLRDPNSEDYLPLAQIEKLFGAAGIDPTREIVIYGVRAASANYFALLTMRYFGAKNVAVYHDGIDGWKAAGLPVVMQAAAPRPIALKLEPQPGVTVTTAEVLAASKRGDVQLVDARSPREYRGEDIRAFRGGHIPGAINIPYEQNWQDPGALAKLQRGQSRDSSGMSLKTRDALQKLYSALDPAKETIVYCQSGVRAAESAAVLRDLGFLNVKVYDSSWLGYGNTLAASAENETYLNIGALNSKISSMQSRIDQLEWALSETQRASQR